MPMLHSRALVWIAKAENSFLTYRLWRRKFNLSLGLREDDADHLYSKPSRTSCLVCGTQWFENGRAKVADGLEESSHCSQYRWAAFPHPLLLAPLTPYSNSCQFW